MPEYVIHSVGDLIDAVRRAENDFDCQVWSRGQADAEWKLTPSAHRKAAILERQVAQMFRLRAPARQARCPDWTDLPGWLTLMRHYGVSTRLLDWTESALIAAYFALPERPTEKPASIWLLSPGRMNELMGEQLIHLISSARAKELVEDAFAGRTSCGALAVDAPQLDMRMAMQLSHYTIHGDGKPMEEHPAAKQFVRKIMIPSASFDRLRGDLSILGVRRSTVFPDLSNLALELEGLIEIQDEQELHRGDGRTPGR